MTSSDIDALIRHRHREDMIFSEMNLGSTNFGTRPSNYRLDHWIATKSWSRAEFLVYEVKASRQDFLNDSKMEKYQVAGTKCILATSPDVVKSVDEVPTGWAWHEATTNCKRLLTRVKGRRMRPEKHVVANMCKSAMMRLSQTPEVMSRKAARALFDSDPEFKRQMQLEVSHELKRELDSAEHDLGACRRTRENSENRVRELEVKCNQLRLIISQAGLSVAGERHHIAKIAASLADSDVMELKNRLNRDVRDLDRLLATIQQVKRTGE